MARLPESITDPVADAIFANYRAKYSAEPARGYLGASSIGKTCNRAHWYSFRWVKPAEFSGRLYRLFQTGHLQEPRINADLRAIGCTVYEYNPQTGKQWSFSEPATGHHFRGNCDGIVTGLPQAPKAPHLAEYKTHSAKSYKVLQTDGVKQAKPEHFAQMQIYMKWTQDLYKDEGCKRALYVAINKDTDDIYTERLEYDAQAAQALIDKALLVITSTTPPVGISTDPTYYLCKWCDYHSLCFGTEAPAVTCRSCAHATPELDGDARWSCATHKADIPLDAQRTGCSGHRYIPILLERMAEPVDMVDGCVTYQMKNGGQFINGDPEQNPTHISSAEIQAVAQKSLLCDPAVVDLRQQMIQQFPGTRLVNGT